MRPAEIPELRMIEDPTVMEVTTDNVLAVFPEFKQFHHAVNDYEPVTSPPKISPVFLVSPKFRDNMMKGKQ